MKSFPGPWFGGPDSMFQDDGASTEVTCTFDLVRASMTGPNGSRTSPSKLKPKMASMTWSVSLRAESKSSTKGICRFFSCVERRLISLVSQLGRAKAVFIAQDTFPSKRAEVSRWDRYCRQLDVIRLTWYSSFLLCFG